MKQMRILRGVAAVFVLALVLASCIRDPNNGQVPDGGGDDKPFIIAFNPKTEGHGSTRAATYDGTWAEFADFFGGAAAQEDDIFTAPNPNPQNLPDGYGREADRKIGSFRVLVYHAGTPGPADTWHTGDLVIKGREYLNKQFDWTEDLADLANKPPFEISVNKGIYDFVFIANENSRSSVFNVTTSGGVQSVNENIATLAKLKELKFLHGGDIDTDEDIPMTAWYPGVEVTTDGFTYYDGGTPVVITGRNSTWDVKMTRAAIRLSFGINMGKAQYDAWLAAHPGGSPALWIEGARNAGFVYPHPFNLAVTNTGHESYNLSPQSVAASTVESGTGVQPGKIKVNSVDGSVDIFFDRIIVPEHLPTDKSEKSTALKATMHFNYGSEIVTKEITVYDPAKTASWGYALPRNTWVWARAEVRTDVNVQLKAVPWGYVPYKTDIEQWDLRTDRSELLFQSTAGRERIEIYTSESGGWDLAVDGDDATWISIPSGEPSHGNMGTNVVTTIAVTGNTGREPRTGHLFLTAGKLTRTITVVQLPASGEIVDTAPPSGTNMYVGAFWKASQYGERLIRVARPASGDMDGTWAAYVIEGNDWIMLDTETSLDSNVGGATSITNISDTNFDANYSVTSYETSVSGIVGATAPAGDIYFRIGLNGPYAPTAERPVRYGLILLTYTKNGAAAYQRIWVRQGEQADYVMRPEEPVIGNMANRPLARRFSPYNLTAQQFTGAAGATTPAVQIYPQNDKNNYAGAFTQYPTQAGAFFKWAHTEGVWAFNPRSTVTSTNFMSSNNTVITPWEGDAASLYESCPPGYRRPTDGITSSIDQNTVNKVSVDDSEMQQSLFAIPIGNTGLFDGHGPVSGANSVWGYYADGWFDRRHATGSSATAPAGTNSAVAYQGRLFYNADGYNSLFFPAAGDRSSGGGSPSGTLEASGAVGYYWTASPSYVHSNTNPAPEGSTAWVTFLNPGGVQRHGAYSRVTGFSIRCVVDGEQTGTFAVSPSVTLDFAGVSNGEKVNIVSADKDGFFLQWRVTGYEVSTDGGATWGPVSTVKPDWLAFPAEGEGGTEYIPVTAQGGTSTVNSAEDTALRAISTPAGSAGAPQDLSYIYNGRQNTANSYIINQYGYYKLPLVYGNAIRNGAVNTMAFNPAATTTGLTGANVMGQFLKHDGDVIMSPYIYDAVNNATPADATLVWMDAPGLVTNIRLVDGKKYLAFDVPHGSIVQGNAVVAVRNAAGTILWSWHIWVTPLVKNTKAAAEYDLTRNRDNVGYNFMKYNLGWATASNRTYSVNRRVRLTIEQTGTGAAPQTVTITQESSSGNTQYFPAGTNPYWMWGRKNPMPPSQGVPGATSDAAAPERTLWYGFKIDGTPYTYNDNYGAPVAAGMAGEIQNPHLFGLGTARYNQWDADNNSAAATILNNNDGNNNVIKTVYDPSPVGFKMPPANAWRGFTQTGNNTATASQFNVDGGWNNGWTFYLDGWKADSKAFYPATGRRLGGIVNRIGWFGYSFPAHPGPNGSYRLLITDSNIAPIESNNINDCMPVRPVEDAAPIRQPVAGVRVPAGVIGYYAEDGPGGRKKGELTLEGDSGLGYGGGTSPVHVYAAYFKWGSLVAINSEDRGTFVAEDIIAAKGFDGNSDPQAALEDMRARVSQGSGYQARWDLVPYGDTDGRTNYEIPEWPETTPHNISEGIGDPCIHYFGIAWKTPSHQDNIDFVGRSGTSANNTVYYSWIAPSGTASATNPGRGYFQQGTAQGTYLPATGYRYYYGTPNAQGTYGYYWSSDTSTTTTNGRSMNFYAVNTNPDNTDNYAQGNAVRCVPLSVSVDKANISFAHNASGTGRAQAVNVTADGPWTASLSGADAANFELTITTPGTAANGWVGSFTVHPTSNNSSTSAARAVTVTVTSIDVPTITASVGVKQRKETDSNILYYNAITQTMEIGDWGAEVDSDNILGFKFGSVVGSDMTTAAHSYVNVKFNPATNGVTAWGSNTTTSTTAIRGYAAADYTANRRNVSDNGYHTLDNVKLGKGDPCRLAGLTPARIAAMTTDAELWAADSGWRLPTALENYEFIGWNPAPSVPATNDSYINSIYGFWSDLASAPAVSAGTTQLTGGYFPVLSPASPTVNTVEGTFLPLAGYRDNNGSAVLSQNSNAYYWSSTAASNANGYNLYLNQNNVNPSGSFSYTNGVAVRCVPDGN